MKEAVHNHVLKMRTVIQSKKKKKKRTCWIFAECIIESDICSKSMYMMGVDPNNSNQDLKSSAHSEKTFLLSFIILSRQINPEV